MRRRTTPTPQNPSLLLPTHHIALHPTNLFPQGQPLRQCSLNMLNLLNPNKSNNTTRKPFKRAMMAAQQQKMRADCCIDIIGSNSQEQENAGLSHKQLLKKEAEYLQENRGWQKFPNKSGKGAKQDPISMHLVNTLEHSTQTFLDHYRRTFQHQANTAARPNTTGHPASRRNSQQSSRKASLGQGRQGSRGGERTIRCYSHTQRSNTIHSLNGLFNPLKRLTIVPPRRRSSRSAEGGMGRIVGRKITISNPYLDSRMLHIE